MKKQLPLLHVMMAVSIIIIAGQFLNTFAQLSEGGVPISFGARLGEIIDTKVLPRVDVAALLEEDAKEEGKNIPYRFGYPMEVNFNLDNSGTWETLPNGDRVWRLKIESNGAYSINFIYNDFWLPEGGKFFIYNEDKSEVIGAFTNRNNNENGEFATGLVRGSAMILEYFEPAIVSSKGFISVSTVVHGYKNLFADDFGQSGSCNINVMCSQGEPWSNEIRSVAMILTSSGSRLCSGAMVNNVRQDLTPYFLTANHCVGTGSNNWIIMFRYQSHNCTNINGPLNYTVQGTQLKASNAASDFALFQLNSSPPDSFQVHYAGWNAIDEPSTKSVGIHHPRGDIKKICFDNDPPTSHAWSGTPANSHWRIGVWDAGTTEPGSSGSPLFDQNKRITGQLHGGAASCTVLDYDSYGKVSFSWTYGTTPATRLKDWLDPDNTGTLVLDGWDPSIGNPDTVAPTAVTNLTVTNPTSATVTLNWTAPIDTSYGGVRKYDLRYSSSPINDTIAFNNATVINIPQTPAPAGTPESFTVTGMGFNQTRYFSLRSRDMWNNWSPLSNSVAGTSLGAPAISANKPAMQHIMANNDLVVDTIIVSNTSSNPSTLNFTVTLDNNVFPNGAYTATLVPVNNETPEAVAVKGEEIRNGGIAIEGFGGPDAFGYKWIDSDEPNGPQYVWNDIVTGGGTQITSWTSFGGTALDDGYSGPFPIGFNFDFYGQNKTTIFVHTNGLIFFAQPTSSFITNGSIPSATTPNDFLSPFWDDLDGRTQGTVHYKAEPNKFTIQFTNWQKYASGGGTGSFTFQIVLHKSGKVMYYYNNMSGTLNSATVGIENATGSTGLQVVKDANYVKNNLALQFQAAPDWLNSNMTSGTLYNGSSAALILTFNSETYPIGNYSMDLKIASNDPSNPMLTIPVIMNIQEIPVELTSFAAEAEDNNVRLTWHTATESNNSGFSVERRNENKASWNELSFIKGAGTTTEQQSYIYADKGLAIGKYYYRLKQTDFDGTISYSNEIEVDISSPKDFILYQNYPNPFNPATNIRFSLPEKAEVKVSIFNNLGQEIFVFDRAEYEAGYHQVPLNLQGFSSGTYYYRIEANSFIDTKKMTFLK
jgi:hypothetical protein